MPLFFISILLSSSLTVPFALAQNQTSVSSPSIQSKEGVFPAEIECKQGLLLILKKSDYSSACVSQDSAKKLVEHGWGLFNATISWFQYDVIYCKNPFGENSTFDNSFPSVEQEFKNKGIILLDLWEYYGDNFAGPFKLECGYHIGIDYLGVPISNMSAMTEYGFKQINSTQVCAGTHCVSIHEERFFCPLGHKGYYQQYKCVNAPSQVLAPTPFDM